MSAAVTLIKALEANRSKLEKERLIKESWERGEREFFAAARVCLDPTVSYGQKKVPLIEEQYEGGDLSFADFIKLAERLRKRELTGHAARDAMIAAAERSVVDDWNYFYRRVILKDFKAGFDHSTVNRVLDAINTPETKLFRVPVFSCQLAKSGDEHPKKMVGPKFLDVKLDGVRLLTVVDVETKTVTQYTRNGNENTNFPHLRADFEKLIPHLPFSVVFDGEVVGRTFQELMSQLNRGSNVNTEDHKVALFDIVPLADFKTGKCAVTQRKRHENLIGLLPLMQELAMNSVTILPKKEVNLSTPEGKQAMEDFRVEVMESAAAAGDECVVEGFMIKDPEAPYVCKKGTNWLKWKPWIARDLTVIGLEQGKEDGKYFHTLGALVCEGWDDGKFISTNVATGISDEDRDFFWNNPDQIVGWIIEAHGDVLTQNEKQVGTNNYSMRFPSYNGRRGLSPGDKI